MSNSSIRSIDRTLSGATTAGQSWPGRNANEGLLQISQSYSYTGASLSDCLILYPGQSLVVSYPSVGMQSYSTASADWSDISRRSFLEEITIDCDSQSERVRSPVVL